MNPALVIKLLETFIEAFEKMDDQDKINLYFEIRDMRDQLEKLKTQLPWSAS